MYTKLRTQRLLLRPLDVCDLETTHAYAGDKESTKYMIALPNETLEETEEFLKQASAEWRKNEPQFYEFAVVLDGLHIGGISITLDETRREGELGWILHKNYWKKGYTTGSGARRQRFCDKYLARIKAYRTLRQQEHRFTQVNGAAWDDAAQRRWNPVQPFLAGGGKGTFIRFGYWGSVVCYFMNNPLKLKKFHIPS